MLSNSSVLPGYHLQHLPPRRLNRQTNHRNERRQNQRPTHINRRTRITTRNIRRNNRGAKSSNSIQETCDASPGTAIGSGEYFWGVGVEDTVHDVLEEGFERGEGKLVVRIGRNGEEKEEDS